MTFRFYLPSVGKKYFTPKLNDKEKISLRVQNNTAQKLSFQRGEPFKFKSVQTSPLVTAPVRSSPPLPPPTPPPLSAFIHQKWNTAQAPLFLLKENFQAKLNAMELKKCQEESALLSKEKIKLNRRNRIGFSVQIALGTGLGVFLILQTILIAVSGSAALTMFGLMPPIILVTLFFIGAVACHLIKSKLKYTEAKHLLFQKQVEIVLLETSDKMSPLRNREVTKKNLSLKQYITKELQKIQWKSFLSKLAALLLIGGGYGTGLFFIFGALLAASFPLSLPWIIATLFVSTSLCGLFFLIYSYNLTPKKEELEQILLLLSVLERKETRERILEKTLTELKHYFYREKGYRLEARLNKAYAVLYSRLSNDESNTLMEYQTLHKRFKKEYLLKEGQFIEEKLFSFSSWGDLENATEQWCDPPRPHSTSQEKKFREMFEPYFDPELLEAHRPLYQKECRLWTKVYHNFKKSSFKLDKHSFKDSAVTKDLIASDSDSALIKRRLGKNLQEFVTRRFKEGKISSQEGGRSFYTYRNHKKWREIPSSLHKRQERTWLLQSLRELGADL